MAIQSHKKSKTFFSRRDFMKISGAGFVSSAFIKPSFKKEDLSINIFSKHPEVVYFAFMAGISLKCEESQEKLLTPPSGPF